MLISLSYITIEISSQLLLVHTNICRCIYLTKLSICIRYIQNTKTNEIKINRSRFKYDSIFQVNCIIYRFNQLIFWSELQYTDTHYYVCASLSQCPRNNTRACPQFVIWNMSDKSFIPGGRYSQRWLKPEEERTRCRAS